MRTRFEVNKTGLVNKVLVYLKVRKHKLGNKKGFFTKLCLPVLFTDNYLMYNAI